jgi:hypothetical protein
MTLTNKGKDSVIGATGCLGWPGEVLDSLGISVRVGVVEGCVWDDCVDSVEEYLQ